MKKLLIILFALLTTGWAQTCSNTINSCGCHITAPGTYTVESDLTSAETCLTVKADNVKLFTNGHSITGTNEQDESVGILVSKSACNVLLLGSGRVPVGNPPDGGGLTVISGYQTGLEVKGDRATIDGFNLYENTIGVSLVGDHGNLGYFEAYNNGTGVLVIGDGNLIGGGSASYFNTVAGVVFDKGANNNTVVDNLIINNGTYGVQVQKGSKGNTFSGNWAWTNGTDLFDGNSTAVNFWALDSFATSNQAYIQ
jgi:hypothetical protein